MQINWNQLILNNYDTVLSFIKFFDLRVQSKSDFCNVLAAIWAVMGIKTPNMTLVTLSGDQRSPKDAIKVS